MINRFNVSLLCAVVLLLPGCFSEPKSTEQLCRENPELRCDDYNIDDGQCRIPRTDMLWHRYARISDPTDGHKIEEYRLLKTYRKCLDLASQILPVDQSIQKQKRVEALVHTGRDMSYLINNLQNSSAPETLYFLWSELGDKQAQRRFLRMENTPALESAEMQYSLATFYISHDQKKTIALLNHSLELSKGPPVHLEILTSLASLNQLLNHKEESYIWAMTGKAFGASLIEDRKLELMYGFSAEKREQLNKIAQSVTQAIKDGNFRAGMISSRLRQRPTAQ